MGSQNDDQKRFANLRVLWTFVQPHRAVVLLGLVLGIAVTGMSLATPMVTKQVLDGLQTNAPLAPVVGLLAALLVLGSGLGLVQWIIMGQLGERVIYEARSSMVRRLFRVRISELTGRSNGEFVTRVTSDTVLLREAAAGSIVSLVNGLIGLVGALVLMAVLDWVLLATTAATLAGIAAIVALLMPKLSKAQEQAQAAIGRLGGVLEGAMRAIRTVKASRAEQRESDRILAEAAESQRQSVRAVRIEAVAWTAVGAGISLAIMLILGIGAYRVNAGALTISALVAFLLYAFQLMGPAMELSQVITSLQSGIAAASRIREIQGLEVEQDQPTDAHAAEPAPVNGTVLSFRDVTARYGPDSAPALAGVTMDVQRIGHTAIIGPSGAGKTSMFSLMLRFLHPEHGTIELDGLSLDRWPLESLRRRIVYVEQDTPLVPGTLAENLRYTHQEATDEQLWEALRAVRLEERVRELPDGLDTVLSTTAISGGERQRVALARALVSDPEILLLDEATAQLDGLTEAAVQQSIHDLSARGAVVTIAHRLSTVIDADQIVLLDAGKVRATGTHLELLERDELYRDLVAALRIATLAPKSPVVEDEEVEEVEVAAPSVGRFRGWM
ncbi:ABC transporter ATP-binding protein [Tenggerimyces flavus]|uniref:ABC transporter ATP-binding protein n=1 Tax=Tenggerimyces flavus TaxID=1708749 RepID=A0ABV7YDA1_9ACTN|nr:ABC transporter ATP-binding protein [Tenggerimyces flavus]MBM7787833.1 ATP-binding cassette subfamily B protein [Tenggerimyces flavus]